jgi:predicted nucleic acid-binding protein
MRLQPRDDEFDEFRDALDEWEAVASLLAAADPDPLLTDELVLRQAAAQLRVRRVLRQIRTQFGLPLPHLDHKAV